jgi:hypothetical protein
MESSGVKLGEFGSVEIQASPSAATKPLAGTAAHDGLEAE